MHNWRLFITFSVEKALSVFAGYAAETDVAHTAVDHLGWRAAGR
jgi:hypothetical protein